MKTLNQLFFKKGLINFGMTLSLLFIMVLFTFVSCSKNEDGIMKESISEANLVTSQRIENAPEQSGAFLFRDDYLFVGKTFIDAKSELILTVGHPDPLPVFCGGNFYDDIIQYQDIIAASNFERIVTLGQGEVQVYVYRGTLENIYDFPSWCPFFSTAPIEAEGMATVTEVINDYGFFGNTNNNVSWSIQVIGKILSPENEIKHLSARILFSWDKEEPISSLLDIVTSVTVRLN
ncbi:hypothetical protein RXV94_10785 [Yeosuana sp. MJ-SS3]|uniref:Lipoprotein n=1 Tax=Gilvirhabdus luticola TaxID=3079858 RepID=A0ABU3U8I0_9FLAO|nr:hypothetical protein [Yeosuana sp. MJ-SS3]MDU8886647.1 hypothetical protein [Yeosuana sp. MJ-SS3]